SVGRCASSCGRMIMRLMKRSFLAIALLAAISVAAQNLPDRKDVVSWKLFAQVEVVKVKDRFQPQFSPGIAALDAKEVKVQGFMMPLEMGDKQSHFILAATPQDCAFCMPGGPESLVEVKAKSPMA